MSVDANPFSRLLRWFVPAGIEGENPSPLETATATDLQTEDSPKKEGELLENQRQEDRDHEREVLLMLHMCC